MNCDKCRTEIEEANLHRPPGHEAWAHIEACGGCYSFHEERLALGRLLGELETIAAPPNFEARLRARIVAEQSSGRKFLVQPNFAPGMLSIAFAACFALTVSAVLFLQPTRSLQQMTGSSYEAVNRGVARFVISPNAPETTASSWQETVGHESNVPPPLYGAVKAAVPPRPRRVSHTAARTKKSSDVMFLIAEKPINSESFSVRSAQVFTPIASADLDSQFSSDARVLALSTDAVPVEVSPRPLEVTLRDEHGVTRSVFVEPVSFGSAQLAGRNSDAQLTSLAGGQGIW